MKNHLFRAKNHRAHFVAKANFEARKRESRPRGRENLLKNWAGTTAVIGVDWGDSGKGRLVDDLAQDADIVARFNGGSNTGHTIKNQFGKFALHIIPSGIFNQKATCLIGRGVALDLESLVEDEMLQLKKAGISIKNLLIDEQATLTMPWHKLKDGLREEYRNAKIGTTKRGVGPTYADRIERVGLRLKDLLSSSFGKNLEEEINFQNKHSFSSNKFFNLQLSFPKILEKYRRYAKIIKPYVAQTIPVIRQAILKKKNILFEGAQGYFLDIDAGTYPYVTSSNTGVLGIWRCFDIHPTEISHVIGITKAYTTRVGAGPMPTKIQTKERDILIERGAEVGTTSGRIRDPGWLDLVLTKAAVDANRVTSLAITKLDVLSGFKNIKVCIGYKMGGKNVGYLSGDSDYLAKCQPVYKTLPGWSQDLSSIRQFKDLPQTAQNYIKTIEKYVGVPIEFISIGPQRGEVIYA